MIQRLHLIRHGITEGNERRLYYGVTDIPLLQKGKEQVRRFAAEGIYPEPETEEYYTTGLIRTEETFSIIYGDRPHRVEADLAERDFGDFEMFSHDELMGDTKYRYWLDNYGPDLRPPGGESANEMIRRVERGASRLLDAQQSYLEDHPESPAESVVICHGGVIALLIANARGVADSKFHKWLPEPARGYTLIYRDGKLIDEEQI